MFITFHSCDCIFFIFPAIRISIQAKIEIQIKIRIRFRIEIRKQNVSIYKISTMLRYSLIKYQQCYTLQSYYLQSWLEIFNSKFDLSIFNLNIHFLRVISFNFNWKNHYFLLLRMTDWINFSIRVLN